MNDVTKDIKQLNVPGEPGSFRLILTLTLAGLFSGILLSTTFTITNPVIEKNKEEAIKKAIFEVLPGAVTMEWVWWENGEMKTGNEAPESREWIYAGYNENGKLTGYAIRGQGVGFQDQISLIFGYLPEKEQIIGYQVLDSRETPGLGDKIFKDMDFVGNFSELDVSEAIELVKNGLKTNGNQVEGITGATISSKAVVGIIQESLEIWVERIKQQEKP